MPLPIIYTHYGDTDYLARTLAAASLTNPEKRRILIGDSTNRHTAQRYGWEHVDMDTCTSPLRDDFSKCFKIIKGKLAVTEKGNRNWAKYVIERWFAVHAFIQKEKIDSFWHFDSDVVIAKSLAPFEQELSHDEIEYTRQCDGACLNGYVCSPVVDDYCRSIIELFNSEDRLQVFQKRYDESEPHHVLTEMEAFVVFAKESNCKGCHLEAYFPDIWFDDAIRRADGCDTVRMGFIGPIVKDVVFDGTEFFVTQDGKKRALAVVNFSWLPISVFDWMLKKIEDANKHPTRGLKERFRDAPLGLEFRKGIFKVWLLENAPGFVRLCKRLLGRGG